MYKITKADESFQNYRPKRLQLSQSIQTNASLVQFHKKLESFCRFYEFMDQIGLRILGKVKTFWKKTFWTPERVTAVFILQTLRKYLVTLNMRVKLMNHWSPHSSHITSHSLDVKFNLENITFALVQPNASPNCFTTLIN